MDIEIRKAGGDETRLLAVLAGVAFYEAYYEQDTPIDIANYITETFSPATVAAELADPQAEFFIAYQNEKAVGFIKLISGTEAEGIDTATCIELKRIYTLERVWGKGVGDALLKFSIERARGLGFEYIWLGVWEQNARALRFYAKYGFEQVGTITFPYGESVGINKVLRLAL